MVKGGYGETEGDRRTFPVLLIQMRAYILLVLSLWLASPSSVVMAQTNQRIALSVDGLQRHLQIDGIGVNINTRSWTGDELKPALDMLVDSLQAKMYRVIVESPKEWEDKNDNEDPFSMNWIYYDSLYETKKFKSVWETIAYLNKKGITNNVMINLMGYLPKWMGYETIPADKEDEFVEMLVSFLYYGKTKRKVQFGLLSPFNECDWRNEGPKLDEKKYTRLLHKIVERMDALQIEGIRLVGPDPADMNAAIRRYIPEMMKDSLVMSRMAKIGVHSYGGYYANIDSAIKHSSLPDSRYWITEWNAWRDSLDEGKIGVYDYAFASEAVAHLLDLFNHNASAAFIWEGFDSYYDHHAPSIFSFWGILGYDSKLHKYAPRKHFYAISQFSKFARPDSWRLELTGANDSLKAIAFYDGYAKKLSIIGVNAYHRPVELGIALKNFFPFSSFNYYFTDATHDLNRKSSLLAVGMDSLNVTVDPLCIFTITGTMQADANGLGGGFLPSGWYAGDIHVHRNCGVYSSIYTVDSLKKMMDKNDLSVVSLLADMGNGEVMDAPVDLKNVSGADDLLSGQDRILHWDAEWHWDATYNNFSNQALGGHLVLLGLKNSKQIWEESPYKILDWAKEQGAVRGFAHLQYLEGRIPDSLNCCIPVDLPVEAALGNLDFVSVDVFGAYSPNNGNYFSNPAMETYYKLLNCGIRLGLAAGTDFPCNESEPLGTVLTYAQVQGKLSYNKWIDGIRSGRTLISRIGNTEFLDFKVKGNAGPGEEIKLPQPGIVNIKVSWQSALPKDGTIEIIQNGKVVGSIGGNSTPGHALTLNLELKIEKSCWVAARRMGGGVYQSQTAPVYVTVNSKSIRPEKSDADYFVKWIDNLLLQTAHGGRWEHYFPNTLASIRKRYQQAKLYYENLSK